MMTLGHVAKVMKMLASLKLFKNVEKSFFTTTIIQFENWSLLYYDLKSLKTYLPFFKYNFVHHFIEY